MNSLIIVRWSLGMKINGCCKDEKAYSGIKGEIRALGNVNVNAIEDYKNVSERYEFLKTQHDDLVEAEATLEKIIAELDEACCCNIS